MAKHIKKKSPLATADKTYDYLMSHRSQILKYITVALVTGILQFLLEQFLGLPAIAVFFLRLIIMFTLLKLWAYPKSGKSVFTIARQAMIAVMLIFIAAALINSLILALAALTQKPILMAYLGGAILELLYFVFYQCIIFKETE